MGHLSIFTREEIESLGPPTPEELPDAGVSESVLRDLALKQLAKLVDPTSPAVAEKLHLPWVLTEELLYQLYREKLIEMRLQSSSGATRYAMLEHGWQRDLHCRATTCARGRRGFQADPDAATLELLAGGLQSFV